MQKTFMMIKPDAIHNFEGIAQMLRYNNLEIEKFSKVKVDMQLMQTLIKHYEEVIDDKGKEGNIVGKMFNSFYFGDFYVIPMIVTYKGKEDIITLTRRLTGTTVPADADSGTIRNIYSDDTYEKANKEDRLLNNVIHSADSKESAARELFLWRKYL